MTSMKDLLPKELKLFINGEFVDSISGKTFPVIQPATEEIICNVSEGDKEDVDLAVKAAEEALHGEWKQMGRIGRQKLLLKFADLWDKYSDDLGKLEAYNNGGPLSLQASVVKNLSTEIRYFAGWVDKVDGKVIQVDGPYHVYTKREPIGVCGLILPWNLPLWVLIMKMVPALCMGNTLVIKPAEQTPLTTLKVMEIMKMAGFPKGVVNVVNGYGPTAGAAMASHMRIRKVAFTGSTAVGRLVMEAAAKSNLKIVQLELGGKSPVIVFPDAPLDFAVDICHTALFSNNGQLCTAGSRTYVHESIYDEFIKKATEKAKKYKIGNQMENDIGPLVDKQQFETVLNYIDKGKKEGAKLLTGGKRFGNKGYFIEPTIFADVTDDMTFAKEEIFGPVMSIIKFKDLKEVIERCNKTEYGLAAAVVTKDISKMFQVANQVQAGTIWVNTYHDTFPYCEFGGYKQSGFGRDGGEDGMLEWTNLKTVCIKVES